MICLKIVARSLFVKTLIESCTAALKNQISNKLNTFPDSISERVKTKLYASVVSKLSFVLKPNKTKIAIKITQTNILQNIDPAESGISLSQVVPTRNGGMQ